MPKVTLHLGLTMPGPEQYSSIRADVDFGEIDTDGDVEAQIKRCAEVLEEVAVQAETSLAQQVSNSSGLSVSGVGLGAELKDFRTKLREWAGKVDTRLEALEGSKNGTSDTGSKPSAKTSKRTKASS